MHVTIMVCFQMQNKGLQTQSVDCQISLKSNLEHVHSWMKRWINRWIERRKIEIILYYLYKERKSGSGRKRGRERQRERESVVYIYQFINQNADR